MLVCNVSLRPPRSAIAADMAEAATAVDATATGNVVFATLVDDPASVDEIVDAFLGEIMLEAASADTVLDAGLAYVDAIDEATTAADTPDGTVTGAPAGYATFDGVAVDVALSNGDLTATHTVGGTGSAGGARSAANKSSGKYYYEITVGLTGIFDFDTYGIRLSTSPYSDGTINCCFAFCVANGGRIYSNDVDTGLGTFYNASSPGTVCQVAVDLTARLIWFRINPGDWNNTSGANPATGTGGIAMAASGSFAPSVTFFGGGGGSSSGRNMTGNFGQTAYTYTPPSGFGNWPAT